MVIPLTILIAFSRMYLYVHYPTDVLGGMIVGCAAGYFGNLACGASDTVLETEDENKEGQKK